MPLAQMEDVPSVLSSVTSALRPNDPQEIYVPWQPKKVENLKKGLGNKKWGASAAVG